MHKTDRIREWMLEPVVSLERHPDYMTKIASSFARIGIPRQTENLDTIAQAIAHIILRAEKQVVVYLDRPYTEVFGSELITEAMQTFLERSTEYPRAHFIIGNRAFLLVRGDQYRGLENIEVDYAPFQIFRYAGEVPKPIRFVINEHKDCWSNPYEEHPSPHYSVYGFRVPQVAERHLEFFKRRYNYA